MRFGKINGKKTTKHRNRNVGAQKTKMVRIVSVKNAAHTSSRISIENKKGIILSKDKNSINLESECEIQMDTERE